MQYPLSGTQGRFIITAPDAATRQIDVEIRMEMLTDVTILKTNHSLFSVRMAADLSVLNGGTMINAEGLKNEEKTFGKSSPWIDYYGKRGNATEGLAILAASFQSVVSFTMVHPRLRIYVTHTDVLA